MQKDNVDDSENPYLPGKPEKSTISTLLVRDAAKKKVGGFIIIMKILSRSH